MNRWSGLIIISLVTGCGLTKVRAPVKALDSAAKPLSSASAAASPVPAAASPTPVPVDPVAPTTPPAQPAASVAAAPLRLSLATQRGTNSPQYVRPNVYDYAPTVMFDGGHYRMWWCGGIAGDFILHAVADTIDGPWHASGSMTPNSYDVAFQPTGNTANFDAGQTCDPSVVVANGTYYLYYGGVGGPSPTTEIGVASSSDGKHFTRLNGGQSIIKATNPAKGGYGAGQPSVVFLNGFFYMIYLDTTGSGALANGAGQFALRSADPLFQTGVEEVTGLEGFTPLNQKTRATYSVANAISADWMYIDTIDAFIVAHTNDTGLITATLLDGKTLKDLGVVNTGLNIVGTWNEGPGLATMPNKHAPQGTDCNLVPVDVIRPVADGSAATSPFNWDLAHAGANLKIADRVCPTTYVSPNSTAPIFAKVGNNGTVSCSTYCAGSQWGSVGACQSAELTATAQLFSCNAVLGSLGDGASQMCNCAPPTFVKHGNNGTASCDTFCGAAQFGLAGTCVSALIAPTNVAYSCSGVPGFLNEGELTCTCAS